MSRKYAAYLSIMVGILVLGSGLYLILAKESLWSVTEAIYGLIGVFGSRSRMWDLFTTTIGLGLVTVGFYGIWAGWRRRP